MSSAIISECGQYRYRLDRECHMRLEDSKVFAYFGINPSTADATLDDPTVRKWIGFTQRNGGNRFIVGNVFSYRATDVKVIGKATFPQGPQHYTHLSQIIAEADVLVPCWCPAGAVAIRCRRTYENTSTGYWRGCIAAVSRFCTSAKPMAAILGTRCFFPTQLSSQRWSQDHDQ